MIESWWRAIKHQWLFLHSLDTIETVRKTCHVLRRAAQHACPALRIQRTDARRNVFLDRSRCSGATANCNAQCQKTAYGRQFASLVQSVQNRTAAGSDPTPTNHHVGDSCRLDLKGGISNDNLLDSLTFWTNHQIWPNSEQNRRRRATQRHLNLLNANEHLSIARTSHKPIRTAPLENASLTSSRTQKSRMS